MSSVYASCVHDLEGFSAVLPDMIIRIINHVHMCVGKVPIQTVYLFVDGPLSRRTVDNP
jgi:hypothetical protein